MRRISPTYAWEVSLYYGIVGNGLKTGNRDGACARGGPEVPCVVEPSPGSRDSDGFRP